MNEIALRLAARLFDQRLIENQFRSTFIEAMLEPHLARFGWRYAGDGWSGWDFDRGKQRLEVKQSAAHQTWSEIRNVQTRGSFDIAPRSGYWFEGGSKYAAEPGRCAQIYVFAWNPVYGPEADHRDVNQWEFYVIPTASLPSQKSISLSKIQTLTRPTKLSGVAERIERLLATGAKS